jgi:hypothetical protein
MGVQKTVQKTIHEAVQLSQCFTDGGQHAEPEHVDFQQAKSLEVVLVPLNDRAIGHRCIFDGDELGEWAARDHEPTDVLGQMTREAQDLPYQREKLLDDRCSRIDPSGGAT